MRPATGEALTRGYAWSMTANWVDFLERTERLVPAAVQRLSVVLANLIAYRARDVLLFSLPHPPGEFVSQPVYAAYLNLIEPWWKVLRLLALKGRRFATWPDIEHPITAPMSYWNQHSGASPPMRSGRAFSKGNAASLALLRRSAGRTSARRQRQKASHTSRSSNWSQNSTQAPPRSRQTSVSTVSSTRPSGRRAVTRCTLTASASVATACGAMRIVSPARSPSPRTAPASASRERHSPAADAVAE